MAAKAKDVVCPSKIFKKEIGDISDLLSTEPNFTTVTNYLLSDDLISQPELKCIKSKPNSDGNQKGSEVTQILLERLDIEDTNEAKERLETICKIFEHKKVANQQLTQIANRMREKLKPSIQTQNAITQFSEAVLEEGPRRTCLNTSEIYEKDHQETGHY